MRSAVHVRSSGSVKIISLDVAIVLARLREAAQALTAREKDVLSVWLFGSLARGEALPGSDSDVLIVLRASDQPFHRRIDHFSGQFSNIGVPVDVLPVTISELETKKNDPFWAKIRAERQRLT